MKTLKNWWIVILTALLAVMDLGFDVINPFLIDLGVEAKTLVYIKVAFGLYALIKAKLELPTQNAEKLQNIIGGRPKVK